MRFESLSHRHREILFGTVSGFCISMLVWMMERGTALVRNLRLFELAIFSITGFFLLTLPEIFIGFFQSGILHNTAQIRGIGEIRFLPILPAVAIIAYFIKHKRKLFIPPQNVITVSQLALWILFAIGLTYSSLREQGLVLLWRFFYYHLFLCILPLFFWKNIESLKKIIYSFGTFSVLTGLSAILAYKRVWTEEAPLLNWVLAADDRIIGCGLIFIVWILIMRSSPKIVNLLLLLALSILVFDLVLNGKRSSILATFLAVICCVLLTRRLNLRILTFISIISLCFFLSLQVAPERYKTKYLDIRSYTEAGSAQNRLKIWDAYLAELKKSPFFGYGTGTAYNTITNYPHNIIIEITYQVGFFGLFLFMLFLWGIGKSIWLVLKKDGPSHYYKSLSILAFCWFIILFVYALFSGDMISNRNLWFIAGIIGALAKVRNSPNKFQYNMKH